MSKVYVVKHCFDYEGYSTLGVFSSLKRANLKVESEYNKRLERYPNNWHLEDDGEYLSIEGSCENIMIDEYDVDGDVPEGVY